MRHGTKALVVVGTVVLLTGMAMAAASPPRRKGALLAWLLAGTYRAQFAGEPDVHASTPEGRVHAPNVRTYYSPTLADDLRAGRSSFRPGAAMVKELYAGSTDRPTGYSVMLKVARRSGPAGRGWLFYETLDGTNRGAYFGRGLRVCTGCHRTGQDFLRSEFRP
jgi:hypothetical protein